MQTHILYYFSELLDKCRTFMESNLCKDSCLAVLVASKQCKMKELTIKSAALLVQNFPFITESKDFKELKHTHLTFILRVVEEEVSKQLVLKKCSAACYDLLIC